MPELQSRMGPNSITKATSRLAIKYAADGFERIFIVNVLGKTGNLLWSFRDEKIRLYERKWIVRMVSIQTLQEVNWEYV